MSDDEIEQMNQEIEDNRTNGFARWGWFAIVEKLADGDITKFDAVYKQNIITALILMTYWHERDKYRERIQKQNRQ